MRQVARSQGWTLVGKGKKKLNDQDKSTLLEMVDAFLHDRKTKKHYAE